MKKIKLSQGKYALLDDDDYEIISKNKWFLGIDGYARRNFYMSNGKQGAILMHRQIMNPIKGMDVDHINHNTLDNRRSNLRIVTRSQNQMNSSSRKNSTSKYKGVFWHKRDCKWVSQIRMNGKLKSLGYFNKETDAAFAYNVKAKELFGEFCYLNKVRGK